MGGARTMNEVEIDTMTHAWKYHKESCYLTEFKILI